MIHDLLGHPHRRHLLLTLLVGAGLVAYLTGSIESSLREEMSRQPIEVALGSARTELEDAVRERVSAALRQFKTGFSVECVCLGDVHPPLDVVPAFREVASAQEDKQAQINRAEAYQYETEALARGQAAEKVLGAEGFRQDRTQRTRGSAHRFVAIAEANRLAPSVTRLRLYLQTVEELLAGRRKIIFDRATGGSQRRLLLGPEGLWGLAPAAMREKTREETGAGENQEP